MNDAELLSFLFVGVIIGFYVLFMRPVQKEQERHKKQMRNLRPGDEVLTTSHIVAKIRDIQIGADGQTRIQLELSPGVIVTAWPNAIYRKLETGPEGAVEASKATPNNSGRSSA
jgi:preprotein translocase YajC subunit